MADQAVTTTSASSPTLLPRITIRFCTQCKWMLRAAYYAQELLSTFSTSLGDVALQPSTGGTFIVNIVYTSNKTMDGQNPEIQQKTLWDRKTDGGFPETKELKRRVRDVIQPERNLGHVDRDYSAPKKASTGTETAAAAATGSCGPKGKEEEGSGCADCDSWMAEETYKGGDFEGAHVGGSGSGSGQQQSQSKGDGETAAAAESGREKKAADTANWMSEETYKDLEGGQQ